MPGAAVRGGARSLAGAVDGMRLCHRDFSKNLQGLARTRGKRAYFEATLYAIDVMTCDAILNAASLFFMR